MPILSQAIQVCDLIFDIFDLPFDIDVTIKVRTLNRIIDILEPNPFTPSFLYIRFNFLKNSLFQFYIHDRIPFYSLPFIGAIRNCL